jgi:hypothetical protein
MKFMFSKRFKSELLKNNKVRYPWMQFCGRMLVCFAIVIMIFPNILIRAAFVVTMLEPLLDDLALPVYQMGFIIIFYLLGVLIVYMLDKWMKRNLPPLFDYGKMPSYAWLSAPMFAFLFLFTSAKLVFSRYFAQELSKNNYARYPRLRFLWQTLTNTAMIVVIFLAITAAFNFPVIVLATSLGDLTPVIHRVVMLITFYLLGVFAAYRLDGWIKNNLPPIFDRF